MRGQGDVYVTLKSPGMKAGVTLENVTLSQELTLKGDREWPGGL